MPANLPQPIRLINRVTAGDFFFFFFLELTRRQPAGHQDRRHDDDAAVLINQRDNVQLPGWGYTETGVSLNCRRSV